MNILKKKNRIKYLVFVTYKNKKVLVKYAGLWNKVKYLIKKISGEKEIGFGKGLMKIKIDTDDELPLN